MPKVKFGKPKPDLLMEAIQGRRHAEHLTLEELGEKCHKSYSQMQRMFQRRTDQWELATLLTVCRVLDMPIDTVRALIRY